MADFMPLTQGITLLKNDDHKSGYPTKMEVSAFLDTKNLSVHTTTLGFLAAYKNPYNQLDFVAALKYNEYTLNEFGVNLMTRNKRQLQKEATKKHIMATATRVYAENGFTTSTSTIAKEAGVSHGVIFAHFPTLNDLLTCILENFSKEVGAKLHSLSESNGSITELLTTHLSILEEYEGLYRRLLSEKPLLPDEMKNMMIAIQSTASFHFSKALEQGIELGSIKNIPIHMFFNTWLGLVHYYLQNSDLFAPNASVLGRYKNELVDVFSTLIKQ